MLATKEEITEQVNKLIVCCNGNIPSLIKSVEATGKKFPKQKAFLETVQAGLERAIGKVT